MKHHYRSSPRWMDNTPPKEPWISKEKFHWQVQDEFLIREAPEALKTAQATAIAWGCPLELDDKACCWRPHTVHVGHRDWSQERNFPCWPAFTVGEVLCRLPWGRLSTVFQSHELWATVTTWQEDHSSGATVVWSWWWQPSALWSDLKPSTQDRIPTLYGSPDPNPKPAGVTGSSRNCYCCFSNKTYCHQPSKFIFISTP